MKNLFLSITTLLVMTLINVSFADGLETFANYPETGNSYQNGTFTGQDGSIWEYLQCRGDQPINGQTPCLGKDRTPVARVSSGIISGGLRTISFDYMQAFSTSVNLDVFVNDILVGNVTSSGEYGVVKNSGDILVNIEGDVYISFIQNNDIAGQVSIDNLVYTDFDGSLPYLQSFENLISKWHQSTNDDFDWTRWQGHTETSLTGPDAAYDGSYYMYTEASSPNSPNKSAGLYAQFDFTGNSEPKISYWYHMFGINMGELKLQVSTDNGVIWADEWVLSGDQGNQWFNNIIDLSSYGNLDNVIIRFWATTGNGYRSDMAIDLIEVYEEVPPECVSLISPSDGATDVPVNTSLTWLPTLEADAYKVYLGTDNPPTNIQNGLDVGNVTEYYPSLEYGVTYYWQIATYNQYGEATGCTVKYFTTPDWHLDLKVFLEGLFMSSYSIMFSSLNMLGYIPLLQPYNTEPWNYTGGESVNEIPSESVIDWILVELHDAPDPNVLADSTLFAKSALLLLDDGQIVDLDGASLPQYNGYIENSLFAMIRYRNHLDIITALPLNESGGNYTYNFSTNESKVLGGSKAHKDLGNGVWGMMAADANADGQIDNRDKDDIWLPQNGNSGYLEGDFNMNGDVDMQDKLKWESNAGKGKQLPE